MRLWAYLSFVLSFGFCLPAYGQSDHMESGASLTAGQLLRSAGGQYVLLMQTDCNLVIYQMVDANHGHATWSSSTSNHGSNCHLDMQEDGNLVIYSGVGRSWAVWVSQTANYPKAVAVMQTDGNLVVIQDDIPTWSAKGGLTYAQPKSLQYTGDVLLTCPLQWNGKTSRFELTVVNTSRNNPSVPYRLETIQDGNVNLVDNVSYSPLFAGQTKIISYPPPLLETGAHFIRLQIWTWYGISSSQANQKVRLVRFYVYSNGQVIITGGGC